LAAADAFAAAEQDPGIFGLNSASGNLAPVEKFRDAPARQKKEKGRVQNTRPFLRS
jgi:hypothetical protein